MRKSILAVVGLGLLLAGTLPASADHIAPHAHYIVTPNGDLVTVGPDACANGSSKAFDNFHLNVHRGTPGVEAFAHEHNPVSIIATGCP